MLSLDKDVSKKIMDDILDHIPCLIIEEQNRALTKPLSTIEVEAMIKDMSRNKSPSLYGFPIEVFVPLWDIIDKEVFGSIYEFFNLGKLFCW